MRALFDVNFLIALLQPDHVHHQRAHEWWEVNRRKGWASCPLTQNGFVRVVSQLRSVPPLSAYEAMDNLAEQVAHTDHVFWPDDVSILDMDLFNRSGILGPKQLTDIYLLGLAVRNGGILVTFDRSIPLAAVRSADSRHLVVL